MKIYLKIFENYIKFIINESQKFLIVKRFWILNLFTEKAEVLELLKMLKHNSLISSLVYLQNSVELHYYIRLQHATNLKF